MLSTCTVCRTPTDYALEDVLTPADIQRLGTTEAPLIGTCGDRACVDTQVDRVLSPTEDSN